MIVGRANPWWPPIVIRVSLREGIAMDFVMRNTKRLNQKLYDVNIDSECCNRLSKP